MRALSLLAALTLSLSAHGATRATKDYAFASTTLQEPAALVAAASYEGDLCPPGSILTLISPDQHALTVEFSTQFAGAASSQCTITVDLDVPAGYQMGFPRIAWHGDGLAATAVRSYHFEGSGSIASLTSELGDGAELRDHADLWSPCASTQRVRFVAAIDVTTPDPSGFFAIVDLDLATTWRSGADYRTGCGDSGVLVEAPPGAAGEWCGGPHSRACQAGLGCEYTEAAATRPDGEGSCVDPGEVVPPAGLLEACGGLRSIGCSGALVCWRRSQAAIDNGWLGSCLDPAGGDAGVACEIGIPPLPCAEARGLYCLRAEHVCTAADGTLNSLCGEGLPACQVGLHCGANDAGRCIQ